MRTALLNTEDDDEEANIGDDYILRVQGAEIAFKDVKYSVPVGSWLGGNQQRKEILHGLSGRVHRGKVNTLFGPTGSGKSSLIDVLAMRKLPSNVSGSIFVDGIPQSEEFRDMAGYVSQDDHLLGNLTCRENIMLSADLRLPPSCSRREKLDLVQGVIDALGLEPCADTLVGDEFRRGLSGGEKKRTSIATELVVRPPVLCLDEPTSGLDSTTTVAVVAQLQALSRVGCTILMAIHQPRFSVFRMLDHIMLLDDGHIVHQGEARRIVDDFASLGFHCENFNNPADFMLDVLGGLVPRNTHAHLGQQLPSARSHPALIDESGDEGLIPDHDVRTWLLLAWQRDPLHLAILSHVDSLANASPRTRETYAIGRHEDYRPSLWAQFCILSRKNLIILSRLPVVVLMQLVVMSFFGILTGMIYHRLPLDGTGLENRLGAFFFLIMSLVFGNLSAIELFLKERALYIHQKHNRYYHPLPYFASLLLCDLIPMRVIPMVAFSSIVYPMMGFQPHASNFCWFLATVIVESICAGTLCYMMSAAIGVFVIANLAISVAFVVSMIYGGMLVQLSTLHPAMRWLQHLSFFKYGYESLAITELHGLIFHNVTYPGDTVTGDEILQRRGIDIDSRGTALFAMLLLAIAFASMAYMFLLRIARSD